MMRKVPTVFITAIAATIIGFGSPSYGAPITSLSYENACTESERWLPEKGGFAPYIQSRIEFSRKGAKAGATGAQSVLRALASRTKGSGNRAEAAAAYWAARSLYDMKLTLQAHHAFNEVISAFKAPETLALRSAAASCLARIHEKYPTLILEPDALASAKTVLSDRNISAAEKVPFYQSLVWSLGRAQSDAEARSLSMHLNDGGFFEKLAAVIIAARAKDAATIGRNVGLLNDPFFSGLPKAERDAWKILFAMSFYDLRKFGDAAKLFNEVGNTSNVFVRALIGLAWSNLWQKRYEEAIGAASNLVVGGLNKTFAPEGYEALAIALLETCNFSTALEISKWFRRSYESPHKYLSELRAKGDSVDTYRLASSFLLGKLKVPERVATEWIGDPVFLANQGEINALIDSMTAHKRLRRFVTHVIADPKYRGQAKRWKTQWQIFDAALLIPEEKIRARQSQLILEIQVALRERNRRMLEALNRSAENIQLVEAEGYEVMGDRLIAEAGPMADKPKKSKDSKNKKSDGPVWDWGSYSGSVDDHGEIWEDELGALRANLKKSCDTP